MRGLFRWKKGGEIIADQLKKWDKNSFVFAQESYTINSCGPSVRTFVGDERQ